MRNPATTSTIVPFPAASRSFGRRPLPSFFAGLTCLVLIVHQENEAKTALFVSDDGDAVGAVWVPRAMLVVDPVDRGRIMVATLSQALANQKGLRPNLVDAAHLRDGEAELLTNAEAVAARTRNSMRGYRTFNRCNGRDYYA
jgi:hypothetical protein